MVYAMPRQCCFVCAQSDLQLRIEAVDGWDVERRVKVAMDALRCADGSADVYAFALIMRELVRALPRRAMLLVLTAL